MSGFITEITDQSFDNAVIKADHSVLVDFWAPWCGPCRLLSPLLEKIAMQYKDKIKIVKLNTDENPEIASKYNISAIPTILFFKNGQVVEQIIGIRPLEEFKKIIDEVL